MRRLIRLPYIGYEIRAEFTGEDIKNPVLPVAGGTGDFWHISQGDGYSAYKQRRFVKYAKQA